MNVFTLQSGGDCILPALVMDHYFMDQVLSKCGREKMCLGDLYAFDKNGPNPFFWFTGVERWIDVTANELPSRTDTFPHKSPILILNLILLILPSQ